MANPTPFHRLVLLTPLLAACHTGTVAWPETPSDAAPDSSAEYRVDEYIGGYNRLSIWRYDASDRSCAVMMLTSPVDAAIDGLTLPATWSLDGVSLVYADDCFAMMNSWENAWSQDAEGTVSFDEPVQDIDVDVWVSFDQQGFDDIHFDAAELDINPL